MLGFTISNNQRFIKRHTISKITTKSCDVYPLIQQKQLVIITQQKAAIPIIKKTNQLALC